VLGRNLKIGVIWRIPFHGLTLHDVWPCNKLIRICAYALGHALAPSTNTSYSSALNSYLNFCKTHDFPIELTEDMLSFYTVYMCYHIKSRSVDSYLAGIQSQLEAYFPSIWQIRWSRLVSKTLQGCKRLRGSEIKRKWPLEPRDIQLLVDVYGKSNDHDDLLFFMQVTSGFSALNQLGELCWPNEKKFQSYDSVALRYTVTWFQDTYGYLLPKHKADQFFKGNCLLLQKTMTVIDPYLPFVWYIRSHDSKFPGNAELWLCDDGSVPKKKWFITCLHRIFPTDVAPNIAGQSLQAGGATALTLAGVPNDHIQAAGHWSSSAFEAYIRKNLFLLQALIWGRPVLQNVSGLAWHLTHHYAQYFFMY